MDLLELSDELLRKIRNNIEMIEYFSNQNKEIQKIVDEILRSSI